MTAFIVAVLAAACAFVIASMVIMVGIACAHAPIKKQKERKRSHGKDRRHQRMAR